MASLQELGRLLRDALSSFQGSDTPPHVRRSAGAWLESFQASQEAWGVVAGLLQDPAAPPDLQLFSAFSLKRKIAKDLDKLDREQWPHLRDVLLQCVQLHPEGPKELLTQIFLGVVGLHRVWGEWEDPLQDVQIRTSRINFLNFLQLLAEESYGDKGRGGQEIGLDYGQIKRWSEPILRYIGNLWENPESPGEVVQAINCFSAWVQLGALHNVELQTYVAIVLKCFEELDSNNVEGCEAAEASIRVIAECAPSALLEKLVNETVNLFERVKREAQTGNATGSIYTRFMQLFGGCLMGNLNGLLYNSQNGEMLRSSLLQSISLPCESAMAIVPVLEVCEALAKHVVEVNQGNEQSHFISKTEQQELLGGIMRETVPQVGKLCRNKKGNELVAITMQELQSRLCDAIGAHTYTEWVMKYMSTPLINGYPWEHVECGLYCSEAIAPVLQQMPHGGDLSLAFLRGLTRIQLPPDDNILVVIIRAMSSSISSLVDVVVLEDTYFEEFESLFVELANLLIHGLGIQGGSQASAEALQKLLSTAIQKNIVIPLDIVSLVIQKATQLGDSGQKMDALLGTTIAAVRNVDDPNSMALREQAASQVLTPIQDLLASTVRHISLNGCSEVLEERLLRALELLNRLLEDTAIWTEDFNGDTCTLDVVNPLLRIFTTSLWPNLVHLCLSGLGSGFVQLLSATAALLLSQMKQCDDQFLGGLFEMCKSRFLDGGHCFVGPLGTAIESQFITPQQAERLLSTAESICSRDNCQSLCNFQKADEMPDVVISTFTLSGHVLRFHTRFPTDRAMAIAERVLKCAAHFCGCRHKDVASAAVAYIKLTLYTIIQAPKECEPLIRCTEINGGEFVQNLIGGILIPMPLPRIHNIVALFVLLATVLGQHCSRGQCPFIEWIHAAFAAYQATGLSCDLATVAVAKWTPVVTDIWEHSRSIDDASLQDFIEKRAQMLKKIVREFADIYMRMFCSSQQP